MSVFLKDAERHLIQIEWAIEVRAEQSAIEAAIELRRKSGYLEQREIAAQCALLAHAVGEQSWREAQLITAELMVVCGDLAVIHGSPGLDGATTAQA